MMTGGTLRRIADFCPVPCLLALLGGACVSSAETADDACTEAAAVVAACLGEPDPGAIESCNRSVAEEVLRNPDCSWIVEAVDRGMADDPSRSLPCELGIDDPACTEVPDLPLGTTVTGRMARSNDKNYWRVVVADPAADDTLVVTLRGSSGDFDLYIRRGALPTLSVHDDWSHRSGSNEDLVVAGVTGGDYFLMVRSYVGSGDYSLAAFLESTAPDTDGDGLWDTVEPVYGLDPASPQYEGQADVVPWSGYWWPYNEGGTSAACAKYDRYVEATRGYDPGLEQWELSRHGSPLAEYWVGHCHAWSAAAILEEEPRAPVTRSGVTFSIGDLKALLTESHFGDTVEFSIGVRIAKSFHLNLLKWLGTMRKAVITDVSATSETWNHPTYKYAITATVDPADAKVRHYVATVTYVSDAVVNPDTYVGTIDYVKTYYYWLRFRAGDIVDSGWEGESANLSNATRHPDFIWRPAQQRVAVGCPLEYEIVREILGP